MDRALKQRLVGASVLIALAVIVLPMMLGGRPEAGAPETRTIEIPPQPAELTFESRRFPVGEVRKSESATQTPDAEPKKPLPQPRSKTPPPANETVDITPLEAPAESPTAAAVDSPQSAAQLQTEPPSGNGQRYLVQVASFGSAANANRLAAKLSDAGFAVLMDSVESQVGVLNRVRIGPFQNEEDAVAAAVQVKSQVQGVAPRVVDLQPQDVAPVTRPADPLVRWVVQVGSFGNPANAENLVKKLREGGRPAFSETITSTDGTSATSTVYRVRIGPFLDRETAKKTESEVEAELGLAGVVMSVD